MSLPPRRAVVLFLVCVSWCYCWHAVEAAEHHKRVLDSWFVTAPGASEDRGPCDAAQVAHLENAVEYAKILANAAAVALSQEEIAFTPAYQRWFGRSNAVEDVRGVILMSHYESVLSYLRGPETGTVRTWRGRQGSGANSIVLSHRKSLVYICASATASLCRDPFYRDSAGISTPAQAVNFQPVLLETNLLALCPDFFNTFSHKAMLHNWIRGSYTPSAGLIILREMQRLDAVVGQHERTRYYARTKAESQNLPDVEKIRNAENYALFALDVLVDPPGKNPPGDPPGENPPGDLDG